MKPLVRVVVVIFFAAFSYSCTDEDKIAAAIQDGTELNEGDPVPFLLQQNYPNPFNPTTLIRYSLSLRMSVRLKIYSEDWQEVTTLVEGVQGPGYYQVSFAATDIPSGEYYYTMEALGITQVRRMRVLK